jgi:hypothetical protein
LNAAREKLYVLVPDLIGGALIDPAARRVLERWCDGEYKAVFNEQLLLAHLKVLARLGLPEKLVKRWSYWFTAVETAVHVPHEDRASPVIEMCEALARKADAKGVVCWRRPEAAGVNWIEGSEFKGVPDS